MDLGSWELLVLTFDLKALGMASPQDAVVFPFIVTQPFDIDGIFGTRVSIQIMSSESFQQEIMTQELWGPREHSWNEDFQVEKSKVSLRICGLLISPFFFPSDYAIAVAVWSLSHLRLFSIPWTEHARSPCPSLSPGVCPSLIMG